jgi:large subunit ribosomal protein L10
MNREQKAAVIEQIAADISAAQAVFAIDYRGITVPQADALRARLRDADASFRVVKNSLTERAADQVGAEILKEYLAGPTALTFVRGDVATAAKTVADYARLTQMLPFKGGLMEGSALDVEQLRSLSKLPSREVLYGQLVGVVASPIGGLVRSLGGLLGGLAVALGPVREKKESGEIPAGEAPAAAAEPQAQAQTDAAGAGSDSGEQEQAPTAEGGEEPQAATEEQKTEPEQEQDAPADDDNKADVSAESEDAETNPTKED